MMIGLPPGVVLSLSRFPSTPQAGWRPGCELRRKHVSYQSVTMGPRHKIQLFGGARGRHLERKAGGERIVAERLDRIERQFASTPRAQHRQLLEHVRRRGD